MAQVRTEKGHWLRYKSDSQGFAVLYPPNWNLLEGSNQRHDRPSFDIINFSNSERWKGVVIKDGGAEILGGKISSLTNATSKLIAQDLAGASAIDKREVVMERKIPNGCSALQIVTWTTDENGGRSAFVFNTAYYCVATKGVYRFWLRNWKDDPLQVQYQATAQSVVLSLRILSVPETNPLPR